MNPSAERPSILSNPRADRVRGVAALGGRSTRSRRGLILVEGPQAVRELLAYRCEYVRDVYISDEAAPLFPDIVDLARRSTRWVHRTTAHVARAMSVDAQGILATATPDSVAGEMPVPSKEPQTYVVICQGRDPGNVGTIIRTADAMGAAAVLTVLGTADVRSPKVIRSSAGSVFHLPIVALPSFATTVDLLRDRGVALLGTSGSATCRELHDLLTSALASGSGPLCSSHAWLLGNEATGLTDEETEGCDHLVRIHMSGKAESLNVAQAGAICLHASQMARLHLA